MDDKKLMEILDNIYGISLREGADFSEGVIDSHHDQAIAQIKALAEETTVGINA